MSLNRYRHSRLIVLNARTTVVKAARTMSTNEIGSIVVRDNRRIAGIVTDRDLALRVVGEARDPRATVLADVMTRSVSTLHPSASQADALRLMRERNVRRVPLVEGNRVVGMVTVDDLLLDEAAPLEEIAAIVRAQLVEGGPARTRRFDEWTAWKRRYARAEASMTKLIAAVQKAAGIDTPEHAETAIGLVTAALVSGLAPERTAKLLARLPVLLQVRLRELPFESAAASPHLLEKEVAQRLGVVRSRAIAIVDAVEAALPLERRALPIAQCAPVRSDRSRAPRGAGRGGRSSPSYGAGAPDAGVRPARGMRRASPRSD